MAQQIWATSGYFHIAVISPLWHKEIATIGQKYFVYRMEFHKSRWSHS